MRDASWLDWPFSRNGTASWRTRSTPGASARWARSIITMRTPPAASWSRPWVRPAGCYAVAGGPGGAWGGALPEVDSRSVCILRETLARHEGLADFAFAMQGLGSGAISLMVPMLRARYLPRVARGEAIAAFALSEPEAGSDVAALACEARLDGDAYVLNGAKT